MSSPTSTSAPNLISGTSGRAAAIAPVAATAQNPVMQIHQRKVPLFHAKKDKDSLTIFDWCDLIDGMKDASDWSDVTTFASVSATLFGVNPKDRFQLGYPLKTEHCKTWTYLKKKMISHFGNMQSSRSFIDAMFGIRQRTDTFDNLDKFNADVDAAFKVVRQMLPHPMLLLQAITLLISARQEKSRSTKMSSTISAWPS